MKIRILRNHVVLIAIYIAIPLAVNRNSIDPIIEITIATMMMLLLSNVFAAKSCWPVLLASLPLAALGNREGYGMMLLVPPLVVIAFSILLRREFTSKHSYFPGVVALASCFIPVPAALASCLWLQHRGYNDWTAFGSAALFLSIALVLSWFFDRRIAGAGPWGVHPWRK